MSFPDPDSLVRNSGVPADSHLGRVLASEVARLGEAEIRATGPGTGATGAGRFERVLRAAQARRGGAVIGEFKLASPSLGTFAPAVTIEAQLEAYEVAGVDAFSVLAEPRFFGGSARHVSRAARFASPVLYKGFVLSPAQLLEAAACGAAAVLLIARVLREHTSRFAEAGRALGLEPLVELHDLAEADFARAAQVRLIGLNARDLVTFEIREVGAGALRARFPDAVLIRESGVSSPAEARAAYASGFDAVLVGEALMRSADPRRFLRETFPENTP